MRKKVKLTVLQEDRQAWLIMDDTGILYSGSGVEIVQVFSYLCAKFEKGHNKKLSDTLKQKYPETEWEGTLRLLRQQSCFKRSREEEKKYRQKRKRKKVTKAVEAFVSVMEDEDFFD